MLITCLYLQCIYEILCHWKRCSKTWNSADQGCCGHLGSPFYLEIWYPWKAKDSSLKCCDVLSYYLRRLAGMINVISLFYRNWGEDRWYYLSKIMKRTQTCYFFPFCPTSTRLLFIPSTRQTLSGFLFRNQNLAQGVFPNRRWIIQGLF